MRPSHFKKQTCFYHLNLSFKTTGYFKNLDWIHIQRNLSNISHQFNVEVQALVMMDTHIHLIFECLQANENFFCQHLESELSDPNELGSHCEPITNLSQYLAACKYIYNNPVEAGIVKTVESYPYSSIQILLGRCIGHCLISDKLGLIQNPQRILSWLNSESEFKISKLNMQRDFVQ